MTEQSSITVAEFFRLLVHDTSSSPSVPVDWDALFALAERYEQIGYLAEWLQARGVFRQLHDLERWTRNDCKPKTPMQQRIAKQDFTDAKPQDFRDLLECIGEVESVVR